MTGGCNVGGGGLLGLSGEIRLSMVKARLGRGRGSDDMEVIVVSEVTGGSGSTGRLGGGAIG